MNYLAHIFLSGDDRRVQIGNFVGDAVKGRAYENYPSGFREGILLHREIDDYTDHHPVVREAIDMLRGDFGRYSGVLTDIYFDHPRLYEKTMFRFIQKYTVKESSEKENENYY